MFENLHIFHISALRGGFEPPLTAPKAAVLPLDDPRTRPLNTLIPTISFILNKCHNINEMTGMIQSLKF
jgi:hypothetical protein